MVHPVRRQHIMQCIPVPRPADPTDRASGVTSKIFTLCHPDLQLHSKTADLPSPCWTLNEKAEEEEGVVRYENTARGQFVSV